MNTEPTNAMAFLDEHHARLTAIEARLDTIERIVNAKANTSRPASARESFPPDVVKVWERVGDPIPPRWVKREDGSIWCGRPPYTDWRKAYSTEATLDAGTNNWGDPVTRIYCRERVTTDAKPRTRN